MPAILSLIANRRKTIREEDLVTRLCNRDTSAFNYLYDHYSSALYGVVLKIIRKEEIAEELLSDIFIRIWGKIHYYDSSKGRLFTWMMNIAKNQALDKLRSREMIYERKIDDIDNLVHSIDCRKYSELAINGIGLDNIVKKLAPEQRFVIEHLYLKGFTQMGIAKEFNIPLGTIKSRTRHAMKELRKMLDVPPFARIRKHFDLERIENSFALISIFYRLSMRYAD